MQDPTPPHPTLTGLVLTYNGERLLEKCLESMAFCDRLLVVDSCSTDATADIALRYGAELIRRPWPGALDQFTFAFTHIHSGWVFSLDQDEICSPELRASILNALPGASPTCCGFYTSRRSWYYDRFMRHSGWYPDRLLRLFRAGGMNVTQSGAHYHFVPKGPTQQLSGDILHYPYANFAQHLDKINSYAQEGALDLQARGRKGGLGRGILHGLGRFVRLYLLKRGFLDGKAGFINAVHGAFYAFMKYVRVGEGDWGKPYTHD